MKYSLLPIVRCAVAAIAVAALSPAQSFHLQFFRPRDPEALIVSSLQGTGSFAVGDLLGDGLPDVVISDGTTVASFLRQPNGTYLTEAAAGLVGAQPLLRDLDGDGDLDIVMAPTSPLAHAGYAARRREPVGWSSLPLPAESTTLLQGLDVGDTDGDGDLDLVVAPLTIGQPALVLLRFQNGAFTAVPNAFQASLPLGVWPRLLDFDRDGDLDVVGSYVNGGLMWLRNLGSTFANVTASMPAARAGVREHWAGDIDGDGFADVLLWLANGDLDLLRGPSLALRPALGTIGDASRLHLGDLDGDGDIDLTADRGTNGIDIFRYGNGSFARSNATSLQVTRVGVGDVDGDHRDEVLATFRSHSTRVAALPDGNDSRMDIGYESSFLPTAEDNATIRAIADFDGDGFTDILFGSVSYQGRTRLARGHGDGTYERRDAICPPLQGNAMAIADLDGDGDLDFVADTGIDIGIYYNDGNAVFTVRSMESRGFDWLLTGDVDADADLDLVVGSFLGVQLYRNLGSSFGTSEQMFALHTYGALADLDGDGDLDFLTDELAPSGLGRLVLENTGTGEFQPSTTIKIGSSRQNANVLVGDADGDGDVDICGNALGSYRLLRNDGNGDFAPIPIPIPVTSFAAPTQFADFDDDSLADLLARGPGTKLLLNAGNNVYLDRTSARVDASRPPSMNAVDVDDDGDLDLPASGGVLINRLRDIRLPAAPHLGAVTTIEVASGPGFSSPGVAFVAYATARTARPLRVPGLLGFLHLDPASTVVAGATSISSIGVTSAVLAVPPTPALAGLEFWLQAAIATHSGRPGFTNAVRERILQ